MAAQAKTLEELLPPDSHIIRMDAADLLGLDKKQTIVYYRGYQRVEAERDKAYQSKYKMPEYKPDENQPRKPGLFFAVFQFDNGQFHIRGGNYLNGEEVSPESGAYFLDPLDPLPYLVIITHGPNSCDLVLYHSNWGSHPSQRILSMGTCLGQVSFKGPSFIGPFDETQHFLMRRKDGQYLFRSPLVSPTMPEKSPLPSVYQFYKGSFVVNNYGNPEVFEPLLKAIKEKAAQLSHGRPGEDSTYEAKQKWDNAFFEVLGDLNAFLYTGHYQEGMKIARGLLKLKQVDTQYSSSVIQEVHVFLGSCYLRQGNKKWKEEFESAADGTNWGRKIGLLMVEGDYYFSVLDFAQALKCYQAAESQLTYTYGVSDKALNCKNRLSTEGYYEKNHPLSKGATP